MCNFSRALVLKLFAAICLFSPLLQKVQAAEPSNAKPNFIVFIADDMGWNDCGAYGNTSVRTPTINRLAAGGLTFTRAYLTCSSCSPSRCSILTGLYPHSTGAGELHLPLDGSRKLVTSYLRDAGYWTAAVGKWHLGENVADQVDYRQGATPEKMAAAWIMALKERPKDKPFFLWAAHSDPHRAYKPGAVTPPHDPADAVVPSFLPDTPIVRKDLALYYDEVSRFDQHVGATLDVLKQQGALENTLVIVMSDNGRPFPHCKTRVTVPGVRTPMVLSWPAQSFGGEIIDSVVSSVDLAPTLLGIAGAAVPQHMQGKNLAVNFEDPEVPTRLYAYAEHNWHDYRAFERAVHSREYCYVRNWLPDTPGTPPADAVKSITYREMLRMHEAGELNDVQAECMKAPRAEEFFFDVMADPECTQNLIEEAAERPELAEALAAHRDALKAWMDATDDRFPGKDALTPDGFDRTSGDRIIKGMHPSLVKKKR